MTTPIEQHATAAPLSAGAFRNLVEAFAHMRILPDLSGVDPAIERKIADARLFVEQHVEDVVWRERLLAAWAAAREGHRESLVLHFTAKSCIDGGRAVRTHAPDWPATLTGEAADVWRVCHAELHTRGFTMEARVLDGPQDVPGELGLFLSWAAHA